MTWEVQRGGHGCVLIVHPGNVSRHVVGGELERVCWDSDGSNAFSFCLLEGRCFDPL